MKSGNSLLSSYGTTIFETMSQLALRHGAINLGQGFPEGLEPPELLERLAEAAANGPHQYPSMMGVLGLRQAIADHEQKWWGLTVDPASEVMVTSGATEALAACFFGLIEPGDEVVLMEPLYDSYLPIIQRAGGVARLVRLVPPLWQLPREELAAAFGPRTKLLVLNSPTNPAGKVYDADELAFIADLLERHDALAVCDEVYEHLTYAGATHVPLSTLPGLRRRCLKIGSAGKIFSLTGWKVGWVVAPPTLLAPVAKAHQYLTFTTPPELQAAVAWGLENMGDYISGLPKLLSARRDKLAVGLAEVGFGVLPAAGSYFLTADFHPLGFEGDDREFCRYLTEMAGVTAIPVSAFYQNSDVSHFVRFCFAKTDAAIDEAILRLGRHFNTDIDHS